MIVSETFDDRGFFQKLRRTQLQLLMAAVGLSYKPSTPATVLASILINSGEMDETDAKLLLQEDRAVKEKLEILADKKERIAELEKNKRKNLAAAKAPKVATRATPEVVVKDDVSTALDNMNYLQLIAHARDVVGIDNVNSIKSKAGVIEAIKAVIVEE